MHLDSKASCLSRFRSWLPLASSTWCQWILCLWSLGNLLCLHLPSWNIFKMSSVLTACSMLLFLYEVPKSKAAKGNTKPNSCAVRSQKKNNTSKKKGNILPNFFFEQEAIPTSLPIPTRSLQKLEASKSGERYQAVVLQVDLSETTLAPMKPSSKRLQTKFLHQLIGFDKFIPIRKSFHYPSSTSSWCKFHIWQFHRLPRLSDAKIRLQVLHAGELIPL